MGDTAVNSPWEVFLFWSMPSSDLVVASTPVLSVNQGPLGKLLGVESRVLSPVPLMQQVPSSTVDALV